MPSVLRSAFVTASLFAASAALAQPTALLAANPTTGTSPLIVGFDTTGSSAGTIAEHLVLIGNGDAVPLAMAAQTTNYNYQMPGFYLAQTWLHDQLGVAVSKPVPITVIRPADNASPPSATVVAAATTDPSNFAFIAKVSAQAADPIVAQRWDFGDGSSDGSDAPFHTYGQPGVYQAGLVATSRAGMPMYARIIVEVSNAGEPGLVPSLLLTASPEDESLLTPVTVSAYVLGVDPSTMVTAAAVEWPDLVDASPTVTPTMTGITVSSQHSVGVPGYYDVPVAVQLAGQPQPLVSDIHLTVGNIDGSPPSPVVLAEPSPNATVDVAYVPNDGATDGRTLLVAGDGPFAFGAASPSPSNFTVDGDGHITWKPTHAQLGPQRVAVRIVDSLGIATVKSWVVDVTDKSSGCAMGGAAPSTSPWLLALVVAALALRRRFATAA
jgi:MYXO-CTERM domain-containing protein